MPKLAVFPKAYMDQLCVDGTMTIEQWIELASKLDVDGMEFYSGFLELQNRGAAAQSRELAEERDLVIPMLCCSPDFTHPEFSFRQTQVDNQKRWIELAAELGGQYCRVLSGQRRPEVSRDEGI